MNVIQNNRIDTRPSAFSIKILYYYNIYPRASGNHVRPEYYNKYIILFYGRNFYIIFGPFHV